MHQLIKIPFSLIVGLMLALNCSLIALAQVRGVEEAKLSYADIVMALRGPIPTNIRGTETQRRARVLADLMVLIKKNGVNRPLSNEFKDLLVDAGANETLLTVIRENSPPNPETPSPTPTPRPQDFAYYRDRGDQFFGSGNFNLAVADYDRALDMNNSALVQTFLKRGRAFTELGSLDRAITDFDRVIALDPSNVRAFQARGEAFEKTKELGRAAADYKKVLEYEPGNSEVGEKLSEIEKELARFAAPGGASPSTLAVLISKAAAEYPREASRQKIEGTIKVSVVVDEKGKVTSARAIEGPAPLHKAAVKAAKNSKFQPATDGQKPIKSTSEIEYEFPPTAQARTDQKQP